jgi:quinol monooxygenase YgiN
MMASVAPIFPIRTPAARKRAVCAVVRAEVRPGASDVFEALMTDFANEVEHAEPGCSSYTVTRTFGSRAHFAAHARFQDWAAFRAHGETAHAKRVLPRLTALLATPISVELFLEV